MLSDNEIKVLRQMLEDSGCGSAETERVKISLRYCFTIENACCLTVIRYSVR